MQHDRVHLVLSVEEQYAASDIVVLRAIWESVQAILDTDSSTSFCLVLCVDRSGSITSHEHGIESDLASSTRDSRDEFRPHTRTQGLSVDDHGTHRALPVQASGSNANGGSASRVSASS
jgi:hypothetical protein